MYTYNYNLEFSSLQMKRRKCVDFVVELISKGSFCKMIEGCGSIYCIPPKMKKVGELKGHQFDVKRLISNVDSLIIGLYFDLRYTSILIAHVDNAFKICIQEMIEKLGSKNILLS